MSGPWFHYGVPARPLDEKQKMLFLNKELMVNNRQRSQDRILRNTDYVIYPFKECLAFNEWFWRLHNVLRRCETVERTSCVRRFVYHVHQLIDVKEPLIKPEWFYPEQSRERFIYKYPKLRWVFGRRSSNDEPFLPSQFEDSEMDWDPEDY